MLKTRKLAGLLVVLMAGGMLAGCTTEMETDDINFSSGIRLTVIHTGDIHSRILPYDMDLMATDERIGMVRAVWRDCTCSDGHSRHTREGSTQLTRRFRRRVSRGTGI